MNVRFPRRVTWVGSGAAVGGAAALAAVWPQLGIAASLAAAGVAALIALRTRWVEVFVALLGVLLGAYMFSGRLVAHIGIPPVYVGELVLGTGVVSLLFTARRARLHPIEVLIVAFMLLGALRTIPYLGIYGLDALRDAVLWIYGIFALAVSRALSERRLRTAVSWYAPLIVPLVVWIPIAAVAEPVSGASAPMLPGTDFSVLTFKGGDAGVHLAGALAFILLGLYPAGTSRTLLLPLWLGAMAAAGVFNRGGLVAANVGWIALLAGRVPRGWRSLAPFVLAAVAAIALIGPSFDFGYRRVVSLAQIRDNLVSLVDDDVNPSLSGTKDFRIRWWSTIVSYTLAGEYFWDGKGFGTNLADDDGFQTMSDHSLRAPHNSHVTVLARMGVPGLALWIALQVCFVAALLRLALRARAAGHAWWSAVAAWLLVYWLAIVVDTSFDPYLEGPQGGIWFWSVVGAGLGVMRLYRGDASRAVAGGPA